MMMMVSLRMIEINYDDGVVENDLNDDEHKTKDTDPEEAALLSQRSSFLLCYK